MARRQQPSNATGASLKWAVHWVVSREGHPRIIEIWCDNDLTKALRIYEKAKVAKKKLVTLRCANSGFPPPEKYQEIRLMPYKRKQQTIYRRELIVMKQANKKGIWWCPYCREFRKFQRQDAFWLDGIAVPSENGRYCPICGTSHRDFHVRKWNPDAQRHYLSTLKRSRTKVASTTRSRRSKRRAA